ncbi:hypothetical protein AGDE_16519 [Angomonas deanei]|uniref:Dpy-30 motif containing protein n=1 Tax=Angomonas deanei TaxID=59799 RepID=A0A7G2CNQ7_9TRYP|nr:hypothetical protein AGDE_16519 [Angomonas deanei]CAD2221488.1 hypothetical protein, conserved [Angomonas deanei]|eukprot:EPY16950.1 hypothetical protein AGDE_16519 [Angomonas deanei]
METTGSTGGVRLRPAGSARAKGDGLVYKKDFFSSPTTQSGGAEVFPREGGKAVPTVVKKIPVALHNFYERLQQYKNHHSLTGSPSESLTVWLQSVMTTGVRGSTNPLPPVTYDSPDLADSEDDENNAVANNEEEGDDSTKGRTATVIVRTAPTRDCAVIHTEVLHSEQTLQASLTAASRFTYHPPRWQGGQQRYFEQSVDGVSVHGSLFYMDVARAVLQGAFVRKDPFVVLQTIGEEEKASRRKELALQQMVLDLLYGGSMPSPPWYGPPLSNDRSNPFSMESNKKKKETPETQEEKRILQRLAEIEEKYQGEAKEREKEELSRERRVLRTTQVSEQSHDYQFVKDEPMETYLMEYVLPSVTPLLADVTRLRPADPVTTMADLLFSHQRQKNL